MSKDTKIMASPMKKLFEARRSTKRFISLSYDIFAITFALYLATCLRLGVVSFDLDYKLLISWAITSAASIIVFTKLGLYRAILRYMVIPAMTTIGVGVAISSVVLALSGFYLQSFLPRSVPLIYLFIALSLIGAPRILARQFLLMANSISQRGPRNNVIIYGAGYSGHQLAQSLEPTGYHVVAFADDNRKLHSTIIAGKTVFHPDQLEHLVIDNDVSSILLALGNAPRSRRGSILKKLGPLGISVQTIPDLTDILTGKARLEDIKDVDVGDLLGRDSVAANNDLMHACVTDKVVMVTGAGGSIGSELCRQIIKQQPKHLVLFELNEFSLYTIEQELQGNSLLVKAGIKLSAIMGSVQKEHRMETIMATFGVQTVYHAAAYKHVPLVENNIVEGVRNNIFGTWYCAEAAIKAGVESFVLISTDKAVRPTNIMGTSKRVAELVLQGLSQRQSGTRFTMVRFGNVLGSSGSVVPLFRRQIKQGGPLTVTHPDIIRYFMTIPEAAELVVQAGSMGKGGDVFVLDMGDPVKIVDLAKQMIHLSGLSVKDDEHPEGDIDIQYTGLRPGEKLYEELLIGDNVEGTQHSRIMRAEEESLNWPATKDLLGQLDVACHDFQCQKVAELLADAPTGYQSSSSIQDSVWLSKQDSAKLRLVT